VLYLFEDCALDTDRRELRRGARLVPVEPQVFDLLQYLIWRRDRVVSKDDMIASIWGGRIVSESALATRINAVRSAIGDSGEAQRLIKTLPRKGIRFVGAVREKRRSMDAVATASVTNAEPKIWTLTTCISAPCLWAFTPDDSKKAIEFLDDALRIDPGDVVARAHAAACYIQHRHWGGPDEAGRRMAIVHANAVRESNTDDAVALSCAGLAFAMLGNDFDSARSLLDRAVTLNPNAAEVVGRSAIVHAFMGHIEQTIEHAERAIQLSPFDPLRCLPLSALTRVNFVSGHYDHSAAWAQRAIQANPHFLVSHALLTASYGRLGRVVEAKEAARRAKSIYPNINWSTLAAAAVPRMEHRQNMVSALREVGLLE
jgi:DNA-binding winged helix-turn-helix (wHTH) protein/tetratricopeptide (TPR) repeat protein